jgi:hypothetical protein
MIESQGTSKVMGDGDVAGDDKRIERRARRKSRWKARMGLEMYRAETERLRALADFLARPVHAHGGSDPDPDVVIAYNLAVESALRAIRRVAQEG